MAEEANVFKPYKIFNPVSPEYSGITYQDLVKPTISSEEASTIIETVSSTLTMVTTTFTFGAAAWFQDGSAAAPSISFVNDVDSGWYRLGANNVGATVNGTAVYDWDATRMYFVTGYKVGIRNSAPGLALEIGTYSSGDGSMAVRTQLANNIQFAISRQTTAGFNGISFHTSNSTTLDSTTYKWSLGERGEGTTENLWFTNNQLIGTKIDSVDGTFMMFSAANSDVFIRARSGLGFSSSSSRPARALEVLDGSSPQLRLTTTQASDFVDLQSSTSRLLVTAVENRLSHGSTNPLYTVYTTGGVLSDELGHVNTNTRLIVGANTTGMSLVANYPMVGHNVYYDTASASWRRIGASYGVALAMDQANGRWVVQTTGTSTAGSLATMTDTMSIANNGHTTWSLSDALTTPHIDIINTSTGDAAYRCAISTTISYAFGIDNSVAGDPFVLSTAASGSAVLGTGNLFSLTSGGLGTWSRSDAVTTPTHDLIQSSTGDASVRFAIGSTNSWAIGADNSDSDSFKLSTAASGSAALGTGDIITVLVGGNVGINTTGPDRRLDILDATNPQLRLTYSDAANYCDFQVDSTGSVYFKPSGLYAEVSGSAAAELGFGVFNANNASGSAGAFIGVTVGGTSAGDAYFFVSDQTNNWTWGIDNSVGGNLVFANSGALGTDNYFTLTTDGRVVANHDGTGTDGGNLFELCSSQNGTSLVAVGNDSNGTSAVAGFYAKAGTTSAPKGISLYHAAAGYTADPGVLGDEGVINGENNTAGIRYRVTNSGNGYHVFLIRDSGTTMREVLRMNAAQNIGLWGSSSTNYQSMVGGMFVANATTVPTGNPTGGGFLYAEGGALKWRGSGGTVTTIAAA